MIKPDEIAVGAVVRLKSGSPKFIVDHIDNRPDGVMVGLFGWHDQHGFISHEVPLEHLVWPRVREDEG